MCFRIGLETLSILIRVNYYVFTQSSGERKGALDQRMTFPLDTVYCTLKLNGF